VPAPKAVPAPRSDPNDIAIPKKTTRKKETTEEKKKAESGKTAATAANAAPTVPKKSATSKTAAKTGSSAAKGSGMGSAEDIKNRFAKALAATEGGTPYGDGQTAGGGTGKSNRIGSPTGSADGVVGGVGQGSPYWQYYEHVHDKMYAAWEQPAELLQKGLTTTLRIRIAKDGSISDVELARSSGNKLLDESARAAANKVHLLEPPPEGLVKGSSAEITVDFQMEGQG
jgi:colicin import membrane protein